MIYFMKSMDTYCSSCLEKGEVQPLTFIMLNLTSGMWTCPKSECIFPMNSPRIKEFIIDDLSTDRVLFLLKKYGEKRKKKKKHQTKTNSTNSGSSKSTKSSEFSSERSYNSHQSFCTTPSEKSDKSNNSFTFENSTFINNKSLSLFQYPVWESEGLRCWLHTELSLLVFNKTLNEEMGSIKKYSMLGDILLHYRKTAMLYNVERNYANIADELGEMRRTVLSFLHPKIFSLYNDEDSPLFSLPLIMKTCQKMYSRCEVEYQCSFTCTDCGFTKDDGFERMIMTIPNVSCDIDFGNEFECLRPCYCCSSVAQKITFKITRYPSILFCHFRQGVSSSVFWTKYNFESDGEKYIVTQIVQYIPFKRHFVVWCYDLKVNRWLLSDDLGDNAVSYTYKRPECRPEEVHMLIWEKESYLKSLVASVPMTPCDNTNANESRPSSRASSVMSETFSPVQTEISPRELKYFPAASSQHDSVKATGLARFKPYRTKQERAAESRLKELERKEEQEVQKKTELKNLHLSKVKKQVPSSVNNSPLYERDNSEEILLHVQKIFSQDFDDDLFASINVGDSTRTTQSNDSDSAYTAQSNINDSTQISKSNVGDSTRTAQSNINDASHTAKSNVGESTHAVQASSTNNTSEITNTAALNDNPAFLLDSLNNDLNFSSTQNLMDDAISDKSTISINYTPISCNNDYPYIDPIEDLLAEVDSQRMNSTQNDSKIIMAGPSNGSLETSLFDSSLNLPTIKSKKKSRAKSRGSKRNDSDSSFGDFIDHIFTDIERQQVADVLMHDDGLTGNEDMDIDQILSGNIL